MNKEINVTAEEKTKKVNKKEKLLIGVAVLSTCAAGYFGVKCANSHNRIEKFENMKKVKTGYNKKALIEPLFLEAEDYKGKSYKWKAIKDLFGLGEIDNVSTIKADVSTIEYFVEK